MMSAWSSSGVKSASDQHKTPSLTMAISSLIISARSTISLSTSSLHHLAKSISFLRATAYMLSAHMLSQFRPSVRPSVCPSVARVIHAKTVVVRIVQFSPYSSPIPLVFARWVSPRNSKGFPLNGGVKQGWGRKNSQFPANNSPYLRNGGR